MSGSLGCTCRKSARRWDSSGLCLSCNHSVHEDQLTPLVLRVLCGGTGITLWRNARGFDTHFPDGTRRKGPIRYGLGDGGADYIGLCGIRGPHLSAFLAVEMKTPLGRLQPNQHNFGALVARLGGVYAVVRSENHAIELLQYLRGGAARPQFVFPPPAQEQPSA